MASPLEAAGTLARAGIVNRATAARVWTGDAERSRTAARHDVRAIVGRHAVLADHRLPIVKFWLVPDPLVRMLGTIQRTHR